MFQNGLVPTRGLKPVEWRRKCKRIKLLPLEERIRSSIFETCRCKHMSKTVQKRKEYVAYIEQYMLRTKQNRYCLG